MIVLLLILPCISAVGYAPYMPPTNYTNIRHDPKYFHNHPDYVHQELDDPEAFIFEYPEANLTPGAHNPCEQDYYCTWCQVPVVYHRNRIVHDSIDFWFKNLSDSDMKFVKKCPEDGYDIG